MQALLVTQSSHWYIAKQLLHKTNKHTRKYIENNNLLLLSCTQ